MERGIGRLCVAVCLGAAGACCIGVIVLDRRMAEMEEVASEPVVDAPEVAAVIQWAKSGSGVWRPVELDDDGGEARAALVAAPLALMRVDAAQVGAARDEMIAVPPNARAGGGKVSAVPGGWVSRGGSGRVMNNAFSRAINRQMVPRLSRSGVRK